MEKPYGEADQERYEDDGTDRKKKEGRREERKGVLRRVISSIVSMMVSDCSYCQRAKTNVLLIITEKLAVFFSADI